MKLKPRSFVPELARHHRRRIAQGACQLRAAGAEAFAKKRAVVKGLAHITGGGFMDNIPRVLPKKCDVVIRKGSWDVPPIFQLIAAKGGVEEAELYQVFNMGIGMTVIVAGDKADAALRFIRAQKQAAWIIGEVARGTGKVRVV